jgi:hypothetical protein
MLKTGDLGVVVSSCVLLTIGLFLAMFNYEPFRTPRQQERVLLRRLRDSWIETLLEITRLTPSSSLFEFRWELHDGSNGNNFQSVGTKPSETPSVSESILKTLDKSRGFLLILGPAGAGKTVTLLELTSQLLKVAQRIPSKPIPVVLNLATWNNRIPFVDWIRGELKLRYDISEDTSLRWLLRNRLLFLLDGLDEVSLEYRESCVFAIKTFVEEMKPPGLVVCSRRDEYAAIKSKLDFPKTLFVIGITKKYLEKYLPRDLRQSVWDLLTAPLRLSIVSRIGVDAIRSAGDLTEQEVNNRLFEAYIESRLKTGRANTKYEPNKVKLWLKWLAKGMRRYSPSIFLIEGLQPCWLGIADRFIYVIASRLAGTIAVMMLGVVTMFFAAKVAALAGASPTAWLYSLLGIGVKPGNLGKWLVVTCAGGGLTMAGVDLIRLFRAGGDTHTSKATSEDPKRVTFVKAASSILVNSIACAVVFFVVAVSIGIDGTGAGSGALVYGLTFGIIFWFRGRGQTWKSDIRPADRLVFSLKHVPLGLGWGTLVGLVAGIFVWLIVGAVAERHLLNLGILIALLCPPIGGTLSSLTKISVSEKTSPNQGIKMSLRSAVMLWLFVSVLSVSAIWIYAVLSAQPAKDSLEAAMFFGMVLGLLFGFSYAGLDVVYHWTLRALLCIRSYAPWRYVRFLDYSADLGFLRRVGGSYVFLHGLLRDHFAGPADESTASDDSSADKAPNKTLKPSVAVG